ncbi:hypothetical protein [Streptomyces sp. NPDC006335]|uniref:hypothetical protein n=1 Tax=Streptomyces sp. NPDC006335 TaxID=3156895 RepID=UPI0033B818EB
MAGPTGRGTSLGAALNDLLRSQVTARHRLSSYNAKHWHAQLSQLTATHRGQQALADAGLSDAEYNIRRNYRDLIHTAYENVALVPADPIPRHIKRGQYEISGVVTTGDDERDRGTATPHPCASTAPAATGTRSRSSGSPVNSPTTSSRTTSSTTSSSRTSARAPTAGSSPAAPTPSNSGNSHSPHQRPNYTPQQRNPHHEPPSITAALTADRRTRRDGRERRAAGDGAARRRGRKPW